MSQTRSENTALTLGHSPDPDDAFMFYALAEDKIDSEGLAFEHILHDIQTLNERALRQELDISAISIHAYTFVLENYAILPCGASMGDNYGPMIVATKPFPVRDLSKKLIAVPGEMTSAYLALKLFLERGDFPHRVIPFDKIMDAVKAGEVDCGLLIHEGQLTYEEEGLTSIVHLGEWWYEKTGGLPLPLGANVVRKSLGKEMLSRINRVLKRSIEYALEPEHRPSAVKHSLQWARGMDHSLADEFVGMYVNDLTLDFGDRGRKSVELFLREAYNLGFVPSPVSLEFVDS